jgi:geranylgeranyl pyrophosphate synthase
MESVNSGIKQQVADIFLKEAPRSEDFHLVLDMMKEFKVLEKTLEVATEYRDRAIMALLETPDGPCRESLRSLADYVVERSS